MASHTPLRTGLARLAVAGLLTISAVGGANHLRAERAGGGFVEGLPDLPLMPGLQVDAESGITFDTPSGRIVEVVARGAVEAAEVLTFYAETLPQLGWSGSSPAEVGGDAASEWRREGEQLRLQIARQGRRVEVRFFLTPG